MIKDNWARELVWFGFGCCLALAISAMGHIGELEPPLEFGYFLVSFVFLMVLIKKLPKT